MTRRAAWRGLVLGISILLCFLRYFLVWIAALLRGRPVSNRERARQMSFCGRLALRAMGIGFRVEGRIPAGATLIVANHLSYLDIVIGGAALPCCFVAKREIASWPVFGPLGKMGGTIFVDRDSSIRAWETVAEVAARLDENIPVLFFPEGTSTDGRELLRFHSALFGPAIDARLQIVPAAISYETQGRLTERDLCWFGDELFLPHLLRVLDADAFTAVIRFGQPEIHPDRRTAAWRTHDAIEAMRTASQSLTGA